MIADLFETNPSTTHQLAKAVGAFAHDLAFAADGPLGGPADEEAVMTRLRDYYLTHGRQQMADFVTGHYRRLCDCRALLARLEAEARAAGLPEELAVLCRRQRIRIDPVMTVGARDRTGGNLMAEGGCIGAYRVGNGRSGPSTCLGYHRSLAAAVESLRGLPCDPNWHGDPCFIVRFEA